MAGEKASDSPRFGEIFSRLLALLNWAFCASFSGVMTPDKRLANRVRRRKALAR
ncbi:hypothetical protein SAMN06295937_1006100 [Sphingopyxis flava]|uniref:Uncharacterized protein n=1 Tax=Sphingopyxis flava TaxID=1507287 RepID=A0A1T5BCV1_9SPHN|nr:hypothetical protein SAMN06295937_1006100 [Sphingopyxis flava]